MRLMKRSASVPWPARHGQHGSKGLLTIALTGILCLVLLSACGLHTGSGEIAFLRGDQVWTVQSDGSSPQALSQSGALDFAWSPDHHQLVFRYTDSPQATTGASPFAPPAPDTPADLAIESVNGGYALQITPMQRGELRSAAWWDVSGNRLAYREGATSGSPTLYVVSQADQPVGIARKILLDDVSIPAMSPDGKRVAVLDPSGAVRVGAPGTLGAVVATGALTTLPAPGNSRPARVLWRPGHDALLYAEASANGVSFIVRDLAGGGTSTLATTASALDAAFSPDGALLLVRTPNSFELWSATGSTTPIFSWPETDPLALPWWSPDSHAILVQDASGWSLVDVVRKSVSSVIAFPPHAGAPPTAVPSSASWTPATSDPWSPDGSQVVFAAPAGSHLNGANLAVPTSGKTGLYVAPFRPGHLDTATLIYSGVPRAPAWGYAAPDTVFLVAG